MNESIFYFLYGFAHRSDFLDGVVFFVAEILPFAVVVFAFYFLLKHHDIMASPNPLQEFARKWKEIFFVFFSAFSAWFIATTIKMLVQTPRPFDFYEEVRPLFEHVTYSFPSQHTVFFVSIAVSLFLIHKKVGIIFMVFALFIGASRIVAGVHYPIDILGGIVIGASISLFLNYFFKKI